MTNGNKLNRTEAISFVDEVKLQFEHDPWKYERFLDIMRDLKKDTISPSEVIDQIATLFKGYPDLAREFNTFLPPRCVIDPKGEEKTSHMLPNTHEGTTVSPGDYVQQRGRRSRRW